MQKLVIFDLDGTLLDSIPDISKYINLMLKKFNYPLRKKEEIMQFIGNGARNLVKRALPNGLPDQRVDECLEYYNDVYTSSGSPDTKLFDGIQELVKELSSRGYRLAILTNKPQMTTDAIYQKYMADLPIDIVYGQRDGVKIKPDPTVTLSIINQLNADPKNTYFVGDGETDVQTAINAGVNGVAVLWGYRKKSQLLNAGAVNFANSMDELLSILQ